MTVVANNTVSIVTPCYNAEKYIRTTMESVLNQTAFKNEKAILDYIIVDGGSKDGTLKIINDVIKQHVLKNCVKVISEPDNGMYDALVKGIKQARGDIFAYINADDYYNINAIDIVLTVMDKYPVKWLTGWAVVYNENGHITAINSQYLFRKKFIAKGVYGTKLPHIQQESTFWRRELNEKIDLEKLSELKYAGDHYLWTEFSKTENLFIVETHLGGFRRREGQLSKNTDQYHKEKSILSHRKINIFNKLLILNDKILWRLSELHEFFNCVRNENKEYAHFIYDWKVKEWTSLNKEWIINKIKQRYFTKTG